ncbi:MAG: UbiA family prenyltransferase [Candidatus Andersenbacteria bacterium]
MKPKYSFAAGLPLCVDMDGTLVRTDTFIELVVALLKRNPLYLGALGWWLCKGRAYCKHQVATRVALSVKHLPYNTDLLTYLRQQHATRRPLFLTTASSVVVAQQVARHLGIFTGVVASSATLNFKGSHKAQALVKKFGERKFAYAGNAPSDLAVWAKAGEGIVVSSNPWLITRARQATYVTSIFGNRSKRVTRWLQALRWHQWPKNILIFVPLMAAHKVTELTLVYNALLAFLAFCLASSSVYILNDLLDLEADRRHHRKRYRPFAAGTLSLSIGFFAVPLLLLASFGVSTLLPASFVWLLTLYLGLTLLYSFLLKQIILVDVFLLAVLYTIRLYAGAAATLVLVSSWLTAFGMFLFLSLAVVKRFSELKHLEATASNAHGRGYTVSDSIPLAQIGIASGYLAAVILALYISSEEIYSLYQTPILLWLLVPLQLYWISRIWFLAHRGVLEDDPLIFAMRDTVSYLVAACAMLVVLGASYYYGAA